MIVDDQPPFRAAARAVIDRVEGFELIAEVGSGEEAVALNGELDARSRADGHQHGRARRHRRHPVDHAVNPSTKVILVSTYALDDLPPHARTSGAIAYVNKDELSPRMIRRSGNPAATPPGSSRLTRGNALFGLEERGGAAAPGPPRRDRGGHVGDDCEADRADGDHRDRQRRIVDHAHVVGERREHLTAHHDAERDAERGTPAP